jgi:hypothetical protein
MAASQSRRPRHAPESLRPFRSAQPRQIDRPHTRSALGERGAVAAYGLVAGGARTGSLGAAAEAARSGVVVYVLKGAGHAGRVPRIGAMEMHVGG